MSGFACGRYLGSVSLTGGCEIGTKLRMEFPDPVPQSGELVVEVPHGFVSPACLVTHAGRQDLEIRHNLIGQDHGVGGADHPDRVQVPPDRGPRVGADPVRPRGSGRFSETGVGDEATGQVLERVQSGRVHRQPLTPPDACDS
jgi:hypothetical protein